jgi:hypothetical protein
LTQGQVEAHLEALMVAMEDATAAFADIARRAAEAEADYKRDRDYATIALIEHGSKMTIPEREARVGAHTEDARRAYLLATAAKDSGREHLTTLRYRQDALRTLGANIRSQT